MWIYLTALIFGVSLLGGIIYFARNDGKKSARLEAIKNELRERERAQAILIMCVTLLLTACGISSNRRSNAPACMVGFDYKDEGVNDTNARALLSHYCLCVEAKFCQ